MPLDENSKIRMQYAGAINLLAEMAVYLGHGVEADDFRDSIERAIQDWCKITGFTYEKVLDRFEILSPEN